MAMPRGTWAAASVAVEVLQQLAAWQAHLHRRWWWLLESSHSSQDVRWGLRLWLCEDVCMVSCVLAMLPCGHSCTWSASIPGPRAHISCHASVIWTCLLHWVLLLPVSSLSPLHCQCMLCEVRCVATVVLHMVP